MKRDLQSGKRNLRTVAEKATIDLKGGFHMGLIEMEKWPQATITGIIGLTFTVGVAVPPDLPRVTITFRDGKTEVNKKTHHAEPPLHAPGTLSSLVSTSTDSSSLHVIAVPDNLEYTPGAFSGRLAADLIFVAKQPVLFPPAA